MPWWIAMSALVGASFQAADPGTLFLIAVAQFSMAFVPAEPEPSDAHETERAGLRVLVCGGRDYDDWAALRRTLLDIHADRGIALIIQGGCPTGADRLAAVFAAQQGMPCAQMEAQWGAHGRKAGPLRNQWMVSLLAPDLVVAFPGGRGTADMLSRARAAGIPINAVGGGDVG